MYQDYLYYLYDFMWFTIIFNTLNIIMLYKLILNVRRHQFTLHKDPYFPFNTCAIKTIMHPS